MNSESALPEPLMVPWELKPVSSAVTGIETLPDGRTRYWIRHDVLRGVTPAMLAWWFANLEGEVEIEGRRLNRYRVWHPRDHVKAEYVRRRPDGSIGPGAAIHLQEVLGRNPRCGVDVVTEIEKLDEQGFIHVPHVHGLPLARMEYEWHEVAGGTLYQNCLIAGITGRFARPFRSLLVPRLFPRSKGEAWLRHNVEEVGSFENFLPELYRKETANPCSSAASM